MKEQIEALEGEHLQARQQIEVLEGELLQNCAMKEQIEVLEVGRLRLEDECRQLRKELSPPAKLEEAKSSVRQLSQQVVALKWQLLEATRRAEMVEATVALRRAQEQTSCLVLPGAAAQGAGGACSRANPAECSFDAVPVGAGSA